jgi:hypothetical protein
MVFTPPGDFAFTRAYVPFLAPPFDDNDGLQSNARFDSYATSTKPRTPQVGLGLLFGDSDFLPHLDGLMSPAVDPLLDSPQLTATNTSPAQLFRLDQFMVPETSSCATDTAAGAVLDASSSAFSIRDWIIQPSSSPAPSRSPTPSPQRCHGGRTDPYADANLLVAASTLPGVPASIILLCWNGKSRRLSCVGFPPPSTS